MEAGENYELVHLGLLVLLTVTGWFLRDMIGQLRLDTHNIKQRLDKVTADVIDHKLSCLHLTHRQWQVEQETLKLRFESIDKRLDRIEGSQS